MEDDEYGDHGDDEGRLPAVNRSALDAGIAVVLRAGQAAPISDGRPVLRAALWSRRSGYGEGEGRRNAHRGELRRTHFVETGHPSGGLARHGPGAILARLVQSTATAHRPLAARTSPGAILDGAITAATLAASIALLRHGGIAGSHLSSEFDPRGATLVVLATLPLLLWRRAPFAVFVATSAVSTLAAGLGYSLGVPLGPTAALYLLAASRDVQDPWVTRTTAVVVAFFVAYLAATGAASGSVPLLDLFHAGLAWAVAWFAGERARLRGEQITYLEEQVARAGREAERERRLAVAEERARIARDLHDSAGHAINVIAVRAGAARLRAQQDPDRSRLALAAIEEIARQTVGEIDQLVGTLRDEQTSGEIDVPTGLASLDTLVAHYKSAGLEVTVATTGSPRPLARAADQAAYRILQEGLTNAARHGAGAASIQLAFGDGALSLTITNPVSATATVRASGGHGLIGMRERASLLGGSLRAGPSNSDFRLDVLLPYGGERG